MTLRHLMRQFLIAIAVVLLVPSAHAELFRSYLSATGSDANPCTIVAPCRLLPAALEVVANGGEIWMLDSANFNASTVNITKSVSILAIPGALGSIVGANGTAAISLATPGTKVSLRNLRIVPVAGSPGNHGLFASGQVQVVIEGGVISGFTTNGVTVTGPVLLRMSDTIVRDNGQSGVHVEDGAQAHLTRVILGGGVYGALALSTMATANPTRLAITESTIEYNTTGINVVTWTATAAATAVVRQSSIHNSSQYGMQANTGLGGTATIAVHGSSLTDNGIGLHAYGAGSRLVAGSNLVAGNGTGLRQDGGGTLVSMGTNTLQGNTTPKIGTITNLPTE